MIYAVEWAYGSLYYPSWGRQSTTSAAKIVSVSASEQITVAEAADHLRIDPEGSPAEYPEQAWLEFAIIAARELCEGLSGLALVPQIVDVAMDSFPMDWNYTMYGNGIRVPVSPLRGVLAVTYPDGSGGQTVIETDQYTVNDFERPPVIYPAYGTSWPTQTAYPGQNKVRVSAGYDLPGDSPLEYPLPKSIRAAMLLAIGHLYENREQVTSAPGPVEIPMGVIALLERFRVRISMA